MNVLQHVITALMHVFRKIMWRWWLNVSSSTANVRISVHFSNKPFLKTQSIKKNSRNFAHRFVKIVQQNVKNTSMITVKNVQRLAASVRKLVNKLHNRVTLSLKRNYYFISLVAKVARDILMRSFKYVCEDWFYRCRLVLSSDMDSLGPNSFARRSIRRRDEFSSTKLFPLTCNRSWSSSFSNYLI